ncbi:MAG: hypothetical protein ACKO1F_15770 [Flammeovirgaceae bacterium]
MYKEGGPLTGLLDGFFKVNAGYTNSSQYKGILKKNLGETGVKLLQYANKLHY